MRHLVSYARTIFWTFGIVQVLAGFYFALVPPHTASLPRGRGFILAAALIEAALGTLFCLAARALRRQGRMARTIVGISSIFNLLVFPFGTVAGAVGLYWCFSRKTRDLEPPTRFEHESMPGDGTHPWIQKAVPVISIGVWFISLAAASSWGRTHGLPSRAALNGLVLILVCELISVFLHELGHAVAGWASDMELVGFHVGPFVAQKRGGGWKFQLSLASILSMGGSAASLPLHLKSLRGRMAFEAAGGPVASLLTASVAFLVLLVIPGSGWEAWWKVPAVTAAISAGAAVLNLIPFGFAAGFSDGAALVQLLRGGPFADLHEAMKLVGATRVTSIRPRDLDAHALSDGLRAGTGRPEEGNLQLIQMICAVDRGDLTAAREHLESGLKRIPAPEKAPDAGCAAEMAFYMAYLDGNAIRAGQWLRGAEKLAASTKISLSRDSDYWSAVTAVRQAEGLRVEAEEAYHRATQLLAVKPSTGLYQAERELLDTVHQGGWLRPPELDPGPFSESLIGSR